MSRCSASVGCGCGCARQLRQIEALLALLALLVQKWVLVVPVVYDAGVNTGREAIV
jgi:hypothetical protein